MQEDSVRTYRIEYMRNLHKEKKNAPPARTFKKPEYRQNKNLIYGSVGTSLFSLIAGIRYERKITNFFYARVGYDRLNMINQIFAPNRNYKVLNAGGSFLIGGNEKFFELGVGISQMFIDEPTAPYTVLFFQVPGYDDEVKSNFNIGYRLQKFNDVTFRVGLGFPESLYLSLGRAF